MCPGAITRQDWPALSWETSGGSIHCLDEFSTYKAHSLASLEIRLCRHSPPRSFLPRHPGINQAHTEDWYINYRMPIYYLQRAIKLAGRQHTLVGRADPSLSEGKLLEKPSYNEKAIYSLTVRKSTFKSTGSSHWPEQIVLSLLKNEYRRSQTLQKRFRKEWGWWW